MKKRLEADLISIAHRILQLKNRSEINQLYLETQKLYEKLAILRFVDEHFGEAKPTIGQAEIVEKMKQFFEDNAASDFNTNMKSEPNVFEEIKTVEIPEYTIEQEIKIDSLVQPETLIIEKIIEPILEFTKQEESEDIVLEDTLFTPSFDLVEEVEEETQTKPAVVQISFEDLLEGNFDETMFVKVNQVENIPTAIALEPAIILGIEEEMETFTSENNEIDIPAAVATNDKNSKGITYPIPK